jgi:hypothetical protein
VTKRKIADLLQPLRQVGMMLLDPLDKLVESLRSCPNLSGVHNHVQSVPVI